MNLNYEIRGKGHPVVLIHSGGADLRDWTFVVPLLAEQFKVIAFDGPGAGKSPNPTGDINLINELKDFLDYLGISEAAIVGHSMGGQIAADFSLEHPEYVSELVLIAPALTGFDYSEDFMKYMNKINEAAPDIDKMIKISQSAPLYRITQASPHRELVENMLHHHIERTFNWPAFEMNWPDPPAAERLRELAPKTLFLIGTEEIKDNLRVRDFYREHTNAQIALISEADHMLTLTHAEELTNHIKNFLEEK